MKLAITRRQFLKSTAAAGAVGTFHFLPARALGKAGFVAPSKRVTLGVIGLGIQGTNDMKGFIGNQEVQVVAVCDAHATQREKGKQVVDTFYSNSDCAAYKDFRELMAQRADAAARRARLPDRAVRAGRAARDAARRA